MTNFKTLLLASLTLLLVGASFAQINNSSGSDESYVPNKADVSQISNAVEETRQTVTQVIAAAPAPKIDEISQYAETLKFSLFVNNVKAAVGSYNLRDILVAKDKLYQVGADLTEYKTIYSGLIVKLEKKTEVLAQILENFGDIQYIPYRFMSTPICENDAFLGVYCNFDFQKGSNLEVNFNAKVSISYGTCESGINENTMNFIHAAIRTLIRNHKEVLASKINSTSNEAAQFVFNTNLYNDVIDKRTQVQQLADITQLFVQKSAFCSECQKSVEKATNSLKQTQASFDKFKPLTEQNSNELADLNNRKSLLEREQAEKSNKTKILDDARSRLNTNRPLIQNFYDTHVAGIYPFADAFNCSARGRNYSIPATLTNANMRSLLTSQASVPDCPFTMNLFYGNENYSPTFIQEVECRSCDPITETPWNEMGNSMVFLDRHAVTCPVGSAINAFKFENNSSQIRISYRCLRSPNIQNTCQTQQTPWNNEGTEFFFLDRHFLDCGVPGRVVNSFRLIRNGGRIALQYTCCNVTGGVASWYRSRPAESFEGHRGNSIGKLSAVACQDNAVLGWFLLQNNFDKIRFETGCVTVNSSASINTTRTTPLNDKGNSSIFFLDRHNVFCFDNNSALTSFRLENHPNNQMRFHYSCTTHPNISGDCKTNYTQWDDTNNGNEGRSLNFLDKHFMVCGKRASLKGFQLERSGSRIRFRYGCCKTETNGSYTMAETRSDAGDFQVDFLDRQFLAARPDEVINSIRMAVSFYSPNQIRLFAEYSKLKK